MFAKTAGSAPEKHLPYFKFIKAVRPGTCPVCDRTTQAMGEWFDNLLDESANDRPLRKRLDEDSGLCAGHTRRLCAMPDRDGLGAAVLFRRRLELVLESLERGKAPRLNTGRCAACDEESGAESRYLGLVADFLDDDGMRAAIVASGGLCLGHLAALMGRRKALPAWFLELHRERSAALHGTLVRYIDSFRLSTEERRAAQSEEEELAWRSFAGFLRGSEH